MPEQFLFTKEKGSLFNVKAWMKLLVKKSTPSRSYNTYSNAYSSRRNDSYDVYNYDDPDDFADDWAEEFGGGNYDGGYDDAYDYWEENYGN